jgi:cell wall assembly regulator SMI1
MDSLIWKYVEPLNNEEAISMFEFENSIKLPNDIISCVKQNNGGRPNKDTFDTQFSKERVFKTLLTYNKGDIEDVFSAFDMLKEEGHNLIPLASDPGGNFICYDTINGIVLWLHETNTTEIIADTFTEFLSKLY